MTDFRGLPVVPAGDPPPAPSAPLHNGASGTDRRGLPGFPAAARNPVGHLARLLPHHHHARAQHSAPSSPEYRPQRRADSPPATSSERPDSQLHRGSAADTGQPEDRGRSRSGRSTDPPRPASVGARRRWSGPPVASDNEPHPSATHRLPVFMPASPHRRQHPPGREAGAAGVPGALEQSECGPPGPQPAVLLGTPLDSCRSWSEVPGPPRVMVAGLWGSMHEVLSVTRTRIPLAAAEHLPAGIAIRCHQRMTEFLRAGRSQLSVQTAGAFPVRVPNTFPA